SLRIGPMITPPSRRRVQKVARETVMIGPPEASATGGDRGASEPILMDEQAANTLQPDSTRHYATTANSEVGSTLATALLVTGGPCSRSHGRGHRLEACHAHQHNWHRRTRYDIGWSADWQQTSGSGGRIVGSNPTWKGGLHPPAFIPPDPPARARGGGWGSSGAA